MAKQNGKEKIQINYLKARKQAERLGHRISTQQERWQQRVNEGLGQIDTVFARAFALPQLTPQLEAINGIRLSPKEIEQVAYHFATMNETNAQNVSAGGSRKERRARKAQENKARREMSPRAWQFLSLLLVLMLLLAACTNVGQIDTAPVEPTRIVEVLPTATAEALPSPAPRPSTPEADEAPINDEVQEDETNQDNSGEIEIDLTRIPEAKLILAAQEVGVTLTPEAVAQFQSTRESGAARKVMYRLAGSGEQATVEIARTNEDGSVSYEVIATPDAQSVTEDLENDGVLLVMADTDTGLIFTIDTNSAGASEVTAAETPEPAPAPTPEEEPTPEATPEFVPNMAFAEEWMEDEIVYFPCTEDEIQACSIQAVFEEFVEYGTYNSPNSGAIPIPNTDWVIELGASVWTKDRNGNPVNYVVPLSMANTQTEERVIGPSWQEVPLPLWQMFDLKIKIPQLFLTLFGNNSSFTYTGDSRDYLNEGDIGMPRLDPGDRMYINFPYGNKDVLGGYLPQQVYDALQPALDAYYGENRTALTIFTGTGDITAYSEALGEDAIFDSEGRPILFNGVGASMFEDVVHNGVRSTD